MENPNTWNECQKLLNYSWRGNITPQDIEVILLNNNFIRSNYFGSILSIINIAFEQIKEQEEKKLIGYSKGTIIYMALKEVGAVD